MKTSARNRLTAILATIAAFVAVGSFFAVSASSHKPTLAVQTAKSLTTTVSSSTQPSSPVSTPVQIAETISVATAPVVSTPLKGKPVVASATPAMKKVVSISTTVVKATHRVLKVTVSKGSTIATRTATGTQTVTVNTGKVKVSVNPVASSASSTGASSTDTTGDSWFGGDGRTLITASPDWTGFIAPTASFAGVLSCVKSTTLEQGWFGGSPSFPYIVSEKWKLTGGNFYMYDPTFGGLRHFTSSDTYYEIGSGIQVFTNNMNISVPSIYVFHFVPFNSLPMSRWADGTADTTRDTDYTITSIYKQSECN